MTMDAKNKRMGGVLMPISSLPSAEGVGTFGKEAYRFVDIISDMGMKIWQILPLNPLGYGNSPYQPFSSYAGDPVYLDLGLMAEDGLIKSKLSKYENADPKKADYTKTAAYKAPYFREAFENFKYRIADGKEDALRAEYDAFKTIFWVRPYGIFITLKAKNDMRCWNEWPQEEQDYIIDGKFDITPYEDDIEYAVFLQFMFCKQWNRLKEYANKKGILLMGDIPFYVGIDSLDVWQGRKNFLLDKDGHPRFIAGVPPDYFSETGQRWGNPIYDWDQLEADGFKFWLDRLSYSAKLYDIIRIDHFRAFDTFWKIPSSCPTAVEGEWIEAPGYKLFDAVYANMPDIFIVAEDLGDLRPEVLVLRDHYKLPGMYIEQFSALDKKGPAENQLIYTGTHDNQTTLGWLKDLDKKTLGKVKRRFLSFTGPGEKLVWKILNHVYKSKARFAIVPAFDLLALDDAARLNTPGTVGSPNWEWRLENLDGLKDRVSMTKKMITESGR